MKSTALSRLSPKDRRALLLGAAIAGSALVFAFGVKPYVRALEATREELHWQRDLLGRERSAVSASKRYPGILETRQSDLARESAPLFDGVDDLSATSDLSDQISQTALTNRVLIQQIETRNSEAMNDGLYAVSIDLRGEGDFEGILHFLNSLETGKKLIRVSRLVLEQATRPGPEGVPQPEVLSLSGTFTGYFAKDEAAETDSDSTLLKRTAGR